MILSIVIPVYNEEKTLSAVLTQIDELHLKNMHKEVIIVNDGSNDKTREICSRFIRQQSDKQEKFILINHESNKGKGAAVRTGFLSAKGDFVVIQDADLEYDPQYLVTLLEPIVRRKASVVYGTRLKRMPNFHHDERTIRFFVHYIGNKALSLITSILYGQWITDMETCYKIFPREVLSGITLHAKGFEFEPEITAKLLKKGYKIVEIPIKTNPRGYKDGKKLNTIRDGLRAVFALVKYRFVD